MLSGKRHINRADFAHSMAPTDSDIQRRQDFDRYARNQAIGKLENEPIDVSRLCCWEEEEKMSCCDYNPRNEICGPTGCELKPLSPHLVSPDTVLLKMLEFRR
jgi:hypothetical protein